MATIYKIIDPNTDEVRYIGLTSLKLDKRLSVHIRKAVKHLNNTNLSAWIRELLAKGLKPKIVAIMETNDKEAAYEAELTLIQAFKLVGHPLLNMRRI